jgi:hypothetical protein
VTIWSHIIEVFGYAFLVELTVLALVAAAIYIPGADERRYRKRRAAMPAPDFSDQDGRDLARASDCTSEIEWCEKVYRL